MIGQMISETTNRDAAAALPLSVQELDSGGNFGSPKRHCFNLLRCEALAPTRSAGFRKINEGTGFYYERLEILK